VVIAVYSAENITIKSEFLSSNFCTLFLNQSTVHWTLCTTYALQAFISCLLWRDTTHR